MKSFDFVTEVHRLAESREPFAVATVVSIDGSSIGKPGFKAIISKEGRIVDGTIGESAPESAISSFALDAMKTGLSRTIRVYLEDAQKAVAGTISSRSEDEVHVETNCGGMMQVFIEPYLPADRFVVFALGGLDGTVDVAGPARCDLSYDLAVAWVKDSEFVTVIGSGPSSADVHPDRVRRKKLLYLRPYILKDGRHGLHFLVRSYLTITKKRTLES